MMDSFPLTPTMPIGSAKSNDYLKTAKDQEKVKEKRHKVHYRL